MKRIWATFSFLTIALLLVASGSAAQLSTGNRPTFQIPSAPTEPPPLEADMVLLSVSVITGDNRPVPLLARDRFEVFEDGVKQTITYFFLDNRPVTVGLLIDDSGFMAKNQKDQNLRDLIPTFLKGKSPADEFFVVQFSSFPRMTVSYTTDAKLAPALFPIVSEATPNTALSDAIYLGIEAIKEAANPRKALLVITAGGDKGCDPESTVSTTTTSTSTNKLATVFGQPIPAIKLVSFAMNQPAQIYSMLIDDDWSKAGDDESPCIQIPKDGNTLDELAGVTGGKAYIVANSQGSVSAIASEVARALKNQYLIGYKSTNTAMNGKRRGVKVKLNGSDDAPKLKVWTKSG